MLGSMALICEMDDGNVLGPDDLAIHEDDWPTWNLGGAKKFAGGAIEDRLILKRKWECASVDLRK